MLAPVDGVVAVPTGPGSARLRRSTGSAARGLGQRRSRPRPDRRRAGAAGGGGASSGLAPAPPTAIVTRPASPASARRGGAQRLGAGRRRSRRATGRRPRPRSRARRSACRGPGRSPASRGGAARGRSTAGRCRAARPPGRRGPRAGRGRRPTRAPGRAGDPVISSVAKCSWATVISPRAHRSPTSCSDREHDVAQRGVERAAAPSSAVERRLRRRWRRKPAARPSSSSTAPSAADRGSAARTQPRRHGVRGLAGGPAAVDQLAHALRALLVVAAVDAVAGRRAGWAQRRRSALPRAQGLRGDADAPAELADAHSEWRLRTCPRAAHVDHFDKHLCKPCKNPVQCAMRQATEVQCRDHRPADLEAIQTPSRPSTGGLAPAAHADRARGAARREAAQDVVQDVFCAIWTRPEAYQPERGSLATFVQLMARSRALDRCARGRRRTRRCSRGALEAQRAAGAASSRRRRPSSGATAPARCCACSTICPTASAPPCCCTTSAG